MGKHKAGKGRSARKARAGLNADGIEQAFKASPHTFIFNRGHVGKNVNSLILEMRRVMEPFTASHLKVRKSNVLKDFVSIAGTLNVSHFLTFSKTEISTYMRIIRMPHGPTLTFKINSYSLSRDIISSLKRHHMDAKQFTHPPMFVASNFTGEGMHLKLMATTFRNLFPQMDIERAQVLNETRRCVLLNYNAADNTIDFRHYNIRVVPAGLGKGVKKLLTAHIPDMSKYTDISEFINRDGNASESEAEMDNDDNTVTLPQDIAGRGNMKAAKSGIRLTEIGPRMTLELVKIEEEVCGGHVMYHNHVIKTEEEKNSLQEMRERKRKLKDLRKQQQAANVKKKEVAKEKNVQKTLEGMKAAANKKKGGKEEAEDSDEGAEPLTATPINASGPASDGEDDDVEYFRQAVGENPDKDLFSMKKSNSGIKRPFKRHEKKEGDGKRMKFDPEDRSRGASRGKSGGSGRGSGRSGSRDDRRDKSSGRSPGGSQQNKNRRDSSAGSFKKNFSSDRKSKPKSEKKMNTGKKFGRGGKKFRS